MQILIPTAIHWVWSWIWHGIFKKQARPQALTSIWEGCFQFMAFWTGLALSVILTLPSVPIRQGRPPRPDELEPLQGLAVFLILAIWHGLFLLEWFVRNQANTVPRPAIEPVPSPAPQRRPAPKPAPSPAPLPINPLDWELEKLKVKQVAQERQRKIAEAKARQTKHPRSDSPFGDPDF